MTVNGANNETNRRLQRLEEGQTETNRRLDKLETGQDELRTGQDELRAGQEELRRTVTRIERNVEALRNDIGPVESLSRAAGGAPRHRANLHGFGLGRNQGSCRPRNRSAGASWGYHWYSTQPVGQLYRRRRDH